MSVLVHNGQVKAHEAQVTPPVNRPVTGKAFLKTHPLTWIKNKVLKLILEEGGV
ncbi:MAG: hypothetical protein ACOYOE_12730 [Chlorobium sp.]